MSKLINNKLADAWQYSLVTAVALGLVMVPELAMAQADSLFGGVLCSVSKWLTGDVGKAMATIGIGILGIGALLGKVTWGMALIVGTGVALIFGGASLVGDIANATGTITAEQAQCSENDRAAPAGGNTSGGSTSGGSTN